VGPVKVTGAPRVQALLSFSAAFRDADPGDRHRATWAWGDGATQTGTVSERNGAGNASAQHAYRSPGSYTVSLSVTDSGGRSTTVHRSVVVQGPVPPVQ
jgi:PKD repeat protein